MLLGDLLLLDTSFPRGGDSVHLGLSLGVNRNCLDSFRRCLQRERDTSSLHNFSQI